MTLPRTRSGWMVWLLFAAWLGGTPLAQAQPTPNVAGDFAGMLGSLHLQLHLQVGANGDLSGSLDSLDQGSMGIPCADFHLDGQAFTFTVPAVHGSWKGTVSSDGSTLSGTWDQGSPLMLNFVRQLVALTAKAVRPPTYDPAMAPVAAADLKSVLDRDLAEALRSGELAPSTGAGVAIAVVERGVRQIFTYGAAKPDSIFEIGSVTKTFTGLVLAQMIAQGKVQIDEPVRALLPPGTVARPAGPEITLLDLATQHSGLPRMPDNFRPVDKDNPYADYGRAELYAFLKKKGVARPPDAGFLYSNLGFGLLGQALAERAGIPYPALLKKEVTDPLGLSDTTVALTPAQKSRFIPGHDAKHRPAHAWDLVAFAGAGAIRSTAADMLTYVEANLHPESVKAAGGSPAAATLPEALNFSHQLRADAHPGMRIALAWLCKSDSGDYWHNGTTGGFSAYVFFNPAGDYAAVVLLNTSIGDNGSFADRLGVHISQRLAGKPAISLAN